MDCDGFDEAALDLLGDERRDGARDEARRHAEGCVRCAAQLASFRRTLDIVKLPTLPTPLGLEARVLAAARAHEAERTPSVWRRVDRWISLAGSYAMRPQLATGLVLTLTMGVSLVLLRARPSAHSSVVVSEKGVPAPAAYDDSAVVAAAPSAAAKGSGTEPSRQAAEARARKSDEERVAVGRAIERDEGAATSNGDGRPPARGLPSSNDESEVAANAPQRAMEQAPMAAAAPGGAAAPNDSQPAANANNTIAGDATFTEATDDYKAKRFADALRGFEVVARGGGPQAPAAALYAARAVRFSAGCGSAVTRFDQVASRYAGTSTAAEAMWDAAQCYREIGQIERAREFFRALRTVAGYRDKAEQELAALADRENNGGAPGRARTRAPARAAPRLPCAVAL